MLTDFRPAQSSFKLPVCLIKWDDKVMHHPFAVMHTANDKLNEILSF